MNNLISFLIVSSLFLTDAMRIRRDDEAAEDTETFRSISRENGFITHELILYHNSFYFIFSFVHLSFFFSFLFFRETSERV